MSFDEFISKWSGKVCDWDGFYGSQCMDLMHYYVYEVLNFKDKSLLAAPAAHMLYSNFKSEWVQYFQKVANTPSGVPKKGDLIIWGTGAGSWGHVAIFLKGDTDKFESFDANWPVGTLPHIQSHDYKNVLGWLTPKSVADPVVEVDQLRQELIDMRKSRNEWKIKYEELEVKYTHELSQKQKQLEGLQADNSKLSENLTTLTQTLTEARLKADKDTEQIAELEKSNASCRGELLVIAEQRDNLLDNLTVLEDKLDQRIDQFGLWEFVRIKYF